MQNYLSQHGELPEENVEGRATGRDDVIYEPRALWQVVDVPFTNVAGKEGAEVVLEGNEWMNGSRYDFVLTHMLMCPINYAVTGDAAEVLRNMSISLSHGATPIAVNRYGPAIGQTLPIAPSPAFGEFGNGQQMPYDYAPLAGTVNPRDRLLYANQPNVFDVARWQFDHPVRLGRRGIVKFGLTSLAAGGIVPDEEIDRLRVTLGFDEAWSSGGGMRMQMRTHVGRLSLSEVGGGTTAFGPNPPQSANTAKVGFNSAPLYPPDSQFPPKEWKSQEAGRGGGDGSGWLQGFTVHLPSYHNVGNIDRLYIPAADQAMGPGVSLATRLGCRAETVAGGTGRSWWRPGAPLALVSPTVGVSMCQQLQTPIRMTNKDQLRIVLRTAGQDNLFAGLIEDLDLGTAEQDRTSAGTFKVGISLTGYAIVKD